MASQILYYSRFVRILGKSFKSTLTSDSYEILRAAAVEGSIVAMLPTRVANRRANELTEIFPSKESASKILQERYKICLISEPNCSSDESDFLAREIKSLISI
jgi:hypothetical protein